MMKWIRTWRRNRARDLVLDIGPKLRAAEAARAGVDPRVWPDDVAWLDFEIERLTKQRDKALRYLEETA